MPCEGEKGAGPLTRWVEEEEELYIYIKQEHSKCSSK